MISRQNSAGERAGFAIIARMDIGGIVVIILIVVGVTFMSMVFHELMHGLTAYWLGDDTAKNDGRLTLNPLKHVDPFMTIILPIILAVAGMPIFGGAKPVPFNPNKVKGGEWGAALVAIAGPLTNLVLAFVCYAVALFVPNMPSLLELILNYSVSINLGFFAFNILPIPPLDGSRVLYAVAPEGVQRAMESVERVGMIFIFMIVMLASPIITKLVALIINGVMYGFNYILLLFI